MDKIREKVTKKINDLVQDEKITKLVEEQIHLFTLEYCKENNIISNSNNQRYIKIYLDKSRSIIHNLDEKSYVGNGQFLKLLKNNKIKINKIVHAEKIFPKRTKEFKQDLELMTKELQDVPETATTTQFTCSKCKRNTKCCYFSMQTRSSDEPMTNFITCLECNHNWRE